MTKVLLVEDNSDLREMIATALEENGFAVESAPDGLTALALQRNAPAEVVVTDIFLPAGDGIETIITLRRDFPSSRIVAISGGARSMNIDYLPLALKLGADKALEKPFDVDELVAAVREVAAYRNAA
jgi:DNA-binding response OmpR family regulator